MKKLLFLSFISFIIFSSCNNDKKETNGSGKETTSKKKTIVGTWSPVDFEMKGETLPAEEKKLMLESGFTVEFTSAGRYTSRFGEEPEMGTYTYDEETGELRTTAENHDGQVDNVKVRWDGDIMIVEDEEGIMKLKRQ